MEFKDKFKRTAGADLNLHGAGVKFKIPRRNSTLKAPVLLKNLGEGIDEMGRISSHRSRSRLKQKGL
ncbi:hypothetical protein [uncultured Campylobacter sp.]|uniref:hypothetical protein n=1 Tax=uncultured Campylobacter sp. TaxID=218934 RepID=UPI00260B9167|nr:hypothetical protein [uncultured Campylobacter sp.]